jgi:alkanesulfonate monooxygenase SsuD/methylene tetrahydromethanopterin reductase-like flavin-dependent oxidoreductase (luciferase family)
MTGEYATTLPPFARRPEDTGMAMPLTRFGLLVSNYSFGLSSEDMFARVGEVAQAVDESAFDSLWLADHLMQGAVGDIAANEGTPERTRRGPAGRRTPMFDALTLLGALAVVTTRVRIGPLVSPITYRSASLFAKAMTTVDVISGGRAVVGLGAGWDSDEHLRFGLPFPAAGERVDRLLDAVHICRAMFDDQTASYDGKYHAIDEAINEPRPVSAHIPILIGGAGARTLRIAADHADACNPIGDAAELRAAFDAVDRRCAETGRDPSEVSRTAGVMFHRVADMPALVADAFAAGADGVTLVPWQLELSPALVETISDRLNSEFGA